MFDLLMDMKSIPNQPQNESGDNFPLNCNRCLINCVGLTKMLP